MNIDLSNFEQGKDGVYKRKKVKTKKVKKSTYKPTLKGVKPNLNAVKINHDTTKGETVYATFEIMGKFPTLNDILLTKSSRYKGKYNDMKKKFETIITDHVNKQLQPIDLKMPFKRKVRMQMVWYVDAKRKDLDNVDAARKFINDALVDIGVILKDNLTIYTEHEALIAIDKNFPRVVVNICKPKYNLI
ncbi:MAG: hypothetical protein AB8G11_02355 [Saprospiraceae bacterium]